MPKYAPARPAEEGDGPTEEEKLEAAFMALEEVFLEEMGLNVAPSPAPE